MSPCVGHCQTLTVSFYSSFNRLVSHASRESHIHVISFCNLIGSALAEPPEVNGLNPQCYQALSSRAQTEEMSLRIPLGMVWEVSHWKYGHYSLKELTSWSKSIYYCDHYTNLFAKTVPSSWMWPHRHPSWWSVLESSLSVHGDQCSTNTKQM